MEADEALSQEARWCAQTQMNRDPKSAHIVHIQLRGYRPRVDNDYQCPRCFVQNGVASTMRAVPGTDQYDMLRCNNDACGVRVIIPL